MRVTAQVFNERRKNSNPAHMDFNKTEDVQIAESFVEGSPQLIAASLRALADAIDPAFPGLPVPTMGARDVR